MKVKWLGHACFLLTSSTGLRVLTDPYASGSGLDYGKIEEAADIVTVSHEHFDHNNVAAVSGSPQIVRGAGTQEVRGINFKGIACFHDTSGGRERGSNIIFCFTIDGIRICHLGDLGHELSQGQIKEIGDVDLLLIPTGGYFTIDAAMATRLWEQLKPKVTIPMHYKTPRCAFPISGVDEFLKGKERVKQVGTSEVEIEAGKLPAAPEIWVLTPAL